jgi:type III restriction enzyme
MLQTALYALYSNYETYYDEWDKARIGVPPVFIVVCQNTARRSMRLAPSIPAR